MVDELRNKVIEAVRDYYNQCCNEHKEFTYIPASGKSIGIEELEAMVQASLDMWLTAGRKIRNFRKA